MSKYQRRHGGSNTSPGVFIIMGLAVVGFLVWKVVTGFQRAKRIHEAEKEEIRQQSPQIIISTDTITGKKDTIVIQ